MLLLDCEMEVVTEITKKIISLTVGLPVHGETQREGKRGNRGCFAVECAIRGSLTRFNVERRCGFFFKRVTPINNEANVQWRIKFSARRYFRLVD